MLQVTALYTNWQVSSFIAVQWVQIGRGHVRSFSPGVETPDTLTFWLTPAVNSRRARANYLRRFNAIIFRAAESR